VSWNDDTQNTTILSARWYSLLYTGKQTYTEIQLKDCTTRLLCLGSKSSGDEKSAKEEIDQLRNIILLDLFAVIVI
jgi:hypothetical protein